LEEDTEFGLAALTPQNNFTMDFQFEQLGLVLNNKVKVLAGVSGTIKHGRVTAGKQCFVHSQYLMIFFCHSDGT
jgi:hypothetical protein